MYSYTSQKYYLFSTLSTLTECMTDYRIKSILKLCTNVHSENLINAQIYVVKMYYLDINCIYDSASDRTRAEM